MARVDLKELVRNAKGFNEQDVRDAGEFIRQVEELGGKRSQYNLASPFSRMPKPGVAPKKKHS
jgi:hypothetical protein